MFRYAAGADAGAYAVVGGRFAVLVAGDAEDAAQLWDAVTTDGAELEDVLTVLARHGVRRAPDFAVVEVMDPATGSMLVVVRGRGRVGIGAAWISAAPELQTWFETTAADVASATLALHPVPPPDAPEPELLPLAGGVAAASVLRWSVRAERPVTSGGTTVLGLSDEDTVLGSLHRRTPDPDAGPDADDAAPAPPAPAPAEAADAESPAETTSPDWLEDAAGDTDADAPSFLSGPRHSPVPTGFALVFDDGRVLRLGPDPVVVGRARRGAGPAGQRWETLPSPAKEVSGTHAELRATGGILLVTDLGSTNGTVIAARDDPPFVLRDGASAHLAPGDRLDFGDGNGALFAPAPPT